MQLKALGAWAVAVGLAACSADDSGKPSSAKRPVEAVAGTPSFGAAGSNGINPPSSPSFPMGAAGMSAIPGGRPPAVPPSSGLPPAPAAMPTPPARPGAPPTPPPGAPPPPAAPPPTGAAGAPAPPAVPPPPPPAGSKTPRVPELTAECPTFRNGTITFMGLGGISMVAGPKASGPTAPMVFYWHGTGSFAGEYAGMAAAVHAGVVAEGGVLISFQGTTGGDALSGTFIFGASDMDLADQLLACAVKNHNVDPRRVFVTGCSAGGLFSTAMAAMRSSYIAAAAPNSGGTSFPPRFETDFTPALMTMHGAMGRDVVGIDFSVSSRTADQAFKGRGGFVVNCDHGGGHCGAGGLSGDVWEFFKAHPYGTEPSPWKDGLPSGFSNVCKIF